MTKRRLKRIQGGVPALTALALAVLLAGCMDDRTYAPGPSAVPFGDAPSFANSCERTASSGPDIPPPSDVAEPETTAPVLPPLHVEGTGLADPKGNEVVLRGVSTHGLAWFPGYVNAAFFRELREEWNANAVRLAMYTAESGGYCTDGDKEQLKQLVRDGVQYAEEQGLYVIVDWHILSDGDPNRYREEAAAFFAEMSAEFSSCDHVLYEICNEPNGVDWHAVKAYAQQVIPVIRANDPDAVILVGTPTWSQDVDQAAADPIAEYDNILYTLHFYAATHRESLRSRLAAALDAGLPVCVSEYGICDASGNGAIDPAEAAAWMELLDAHGVGCVVWNLSNKGETSALFKTSCTKTSGFVWDDLSASGQWVYEMLTERGSSDAPRAAERAGAIQQAGPKTGESPGENWPAEAAPAPPREASGTSTDPLQADASASAPAGETAILSGDGLSVTAVLQNEWEANGGPVYQYSVTVVNISQSRCERWKLGLSFAQEFTLLDGWNGDYTVQGGTLFISGKDYNGALDPGGSAADIGFIVAGGGEITVE